MSKKKKSLSIKIKGQDWEIYSQSNASYIRNHGKDSYAITYPKQREIYFNSNHFDLSIIKHELMHGYIASSNTTSSNLNVDQLEELVCEIYGDYDDEMRLYASKICNFILGA